MYDNNNKGALWLKTAKSGQKYMGGEVMINGQKYYISVLKNNNKQSEKHPDYNILVNIPNNNQQSQGQVNTPPAQGINNSHSYNANEVKQIFANDHESDDVPF